jgi:hypothetical protein
MSALFQTLPLISPPAVALSWFTTGTGHAALGASTFSSQGTGYVIANILDFGNNGWNLHEIVL